MFSKGLSWRTRKKPPSMLTTPPSQPVTSSNTVYSNISAPSSA
ncbi:unnamed protein product, partial [Rotaria magnacalcarata]